jgi:hypothetical protein
MAISGGHSVFSSGPKITQAVPTAQRTPTIPTEYGIPTMAMDSIDPRVSEVPALDAAYEYKGENANSRFPKLEGAEQHREYPQNVKSVKEKEPLRTGSFNDEDVAEDAIHPAHSAPSTGSVIERYKNQVENPMPKKPKATAKDGDGDGDIAEDVAEDAHPIKPYHDVLRKHGFAPAKHEGWGDVETKQGRVTHKGSDEHKTQYRLNSYKNENGNTVSLRYLKGEAYGDKRGTTKSFTETPTNLLVGSTPAKLDEHLHKQSYTYNPPSDIPKPPSTKERKEYYRKIKE